MTRKELELATENEQTVWLSEECWVIQRDDGKFFDYMTIDKIPHFCNDIISSFDFSVNLYKQDNKSKYLIEEKIRNLNLQNCRPVKVEIKVVGE